MTRIPADPDNMKKAFHRHTDALREVNNNSRARSLLLFYAVECGLKFAHLKERGEGDAAQLGVEIFGPDGHDVLLAAHRLDLNVKGVSEPKTTFRLEKGRKDYEINTIHQAWRYGVMVQPQQELVIIHWLVAAHGVLLKEYFS